MSDVQEGVTFLWKIENFSMLTQRQGEALVSPEFIFESTLDKIKLCLWLRPKGDKGEGNADYLSLYLAKADDSDKASNLSFTLMVESADSALKKSLGGENINFDTSGKGFSQFILLKTLIDNKNVYLPQDVLTVGCRIWSSQQNGEPTTLSNFGKECCVRTTIDVQKRVLTWPITKITELKKSKEKISLNLDNNLNLEGAPSLKLSFCIDKDSNDGYARIEIFQTEHSGEKCLFVKCKITVVNAGQCISHEDSHLFSSNPEEIWHFPDFISIDNIIDDKYIYLDDTMFLQCEFTFSRQGSERHSGLPVYMSMSNAFPFLAKQPTEFTNLSRKIGGLFAREKFCDVEIRAGSKTFPCHKLILCAQSPVFSAMFENDMKEKETGVVPITDLTHQTLENLLNFLYMEVIEDGLLVEDICELYTAADKYEILLLQRRCSILLVSKLSVENVCTVLATADTHQDKFLLTHVNTFLSIHSREVFCSPQWKDFMVENPALTTKTMFKICIE